jgi:deoxyribose-phosphate aldolase
MVNLAPFIEHTLLRPDAVAEDYERLCREACECGFYGVCVPPQRVGLARSLLSGSAVRVVTVAGFPFGFQDLAAKEKEVEEALAKGADEVDAVIHIGALKEGRFSEVGREVSALVKVVSSAGKGEGRPLLKMIIETCYLTDEEKVAAARLIRDAGADFVKTSTGFGPGGATVEDVALLIRATGGELRVKASGGIRTKEQALALIAAGAARLGTSRGPDLVK